jgi:hypothetical protein
MNSALRILIAVGTLITATNTTHAQTKDRTVARLFWQDAADQSLKSGDLKRGDSWKIATAKVDGFPTLDPDKQTHVQMEYANGILLTGIHDTEDGTFQSGWVAIETGVTQELHGDHSHWHFGASPKVIASRMDKEQGNPAHVYLYDGAFYLANDKKNGFTMVSPSALRVNNGAKADQFISAGGGHITLAAIGGNVAYATWIDRQGDNLGRVDVVGLGSNAGRDYRFQLPSGGIHGATANAGKIFFAPSDGICWVEADENLSKRANQIAINHVSLGKDEQGNPKRTGAFENAGSHVLFTVGRGADAALCMLEATSPKPALIKLDLSVSEGSSITTPAAVQSRKGERFALLFEESSSGQQPEKLHVVALDPNRDGNCSDAKLHTSITVGRSLIEGHSGHHEVAALGRSFVAISNPGDGTIAVLSTNDWTVQATLQVGGTPTRLVAVGAD